ncbi:MAG: hypothetical protein UCI88_10745 [Megasphaera massiliensis]|uniref:hypothetical protein n=2 Tax=Megasphaera massiliensis TaxID=1232428 RepID=UPI00210BCA60|nr:hypothetical protein [Megasphaera massiliensis]MCQ5210859.1 hypothetical protein [Megasphaera massiliensis]MEE0659555.1 hypothetical protein [Megasphaera massiliensis]
MESFEAINKQLMERIEAADFDEAMKKTIHQSLDKLSQYERDQLKGIRETIEKTVPDRVKWSRNWKITTALVPKTELGVWEENHFYPVETSGLGFFCSDWEETDVRDCGHRQFFWKGTYEGLQDVIEQGAAYEGIVTDKDGDTYQFQYQLVLEPSCRRRESRLYQLAALYGIQAPVIFSPWGRRQLTIRLKSLDLTAEAFFDDYSRWDFCWQQNGLQDKIIENQELVWNVKQLPYDGDSIEGEWIPDANTGSAETRFTESNGVQWGTFLQLASSEEEPAVSEVIEKSENKIILRTLDKAHMDIKGIRIEPTDEVPKYSFSNEYEGGMTVQRLISKADVERALHRYQSSGFCCGRPSLKAPEKGQMVRLYREEDMYGGNREDILYQQERLKRLVPCYIQFFLDPRALDWQRDFLPDYAVYVLADLRRRFPDFSWKGVLQ